MKGFTHFMSGLAAASCFPQAVAAATDGNPLYFILGGVAALLPDTLDFKVLRYFYRHDAELIPDPLDPDPQWIADAMAAAIDEAARRQRPFRLRLHTIRLAADRWQRYRIRLDPARRQVTASLAEITDTGGNPEPGAPPAPCEATADFHVPLRLQYTAVTLVDIFDGPHFEMIPEPDGTVTAAFIPWHRHCSHSLCFGIIPAALAGWVWGTTAGAVVFCAHAAHALVDQLGYMGSNLFWPFTRRRTPGLMWHHAAQSLPNLAVVWISALLIYANLAMGTALADDTMPGRLRLVLLGGVLPFALLARQRPRVQTAAPPGGNPRMRGST